MSAVETQEMKERAAWIAGLRELADWLDQNPDIPYPGYAGQQFTVFAHTKQELAELARQVGGRFEKQVTDNWVMLRRTFGPHCYEICIARQQVCERRVVGTREVPEVVIPAHKAEIIEWECLPILEDESNGGGQ
jgi:hypothetical protein